MTKVYVILRQPSKEHQTYVLASFSTEKMHGSECNPMAYHMPRPMRTLSSLSKPTQTTSTGSVTL